MAMLFVNYGYLPNFQASLQERILMNSLATIEEVNSTRRRFRISVPTTDVKEAFRKAVTDVQKNAEVRGFRKGKVPDNLVRKFFENDVRKKAYEEIVEASYQEAIKTAEFQIVSYPHIEVEGQFTEGNEFLFTATVDINPTVQITGYKDLVLKAPAQKTPELEEQVETTILQMCRERGTFVKLADDRQAQKGDYLKINYTLTHEGKELTEKSRTESRLQLDGTNIAELEAGLLGQKTGETRNFTVNFKADYHEADLAGKTIEFKATVIAIEELNAPALDDTFALGFGVPTFDDLKSNIRSSIMNMMERTRVAQFRDQIIGLVLEKNQFEVPESLVEGTVDRAIAEQNGRRDKKSQIDSALEENRAKFREWALREVRGVLALGHIAREETLTVEDREVSSEMASFAMQNGTNVQQMIRQFGNQVIEEFRGKVLIDKVIKHIIGLSKIETAG